MMKQIACLAATLGLAACGGGGGSSFDGPPQAELNFRPTADEVLADIARLDKLVGTLVVDPPDEASYSGSMTILLTDTDLDAVAVGDVGIVVDYQNSEITGAVTDIVVSEDRLVAYSSPEDLRVNGRPNPTGASIGIGGTILLPDGDTAILDGGITTVAGDRTAVADGAPEAYVGTESGIIAFNQPTMTVEATVFVFEDN